MKKTLFTLAFIIFSLLLHAQEREQTGFSFNNFMKNRQIKGDTIWQFHRYDVYQWVNNEYFLLHTAYLEWDSAAPNYKSILWVNNNETDTAYKDIYTYDDKNRIICSINQQYINGSLVNYSKTEIYYQSFEPDSVYGYYDSLYISYTWDTHDSVWEKSKLRKFRYDEYNHLASDVTYVWDGQEWQLNSGRKSVHKHNEFGSVVSLTILYYHSDIHQWVNSSKTIFFLINDTTGEFNAYDVYFWKNGRWENGEKWTEVVYHNWQGWPRYQFELEYDILQVWQNNRWYYAQKDSITYYPNGSTLMYQYYWDETNNNWYYGVRYNDEFNEMGFRKLISKEWWHNESWDTIWADRYYFEYLTPDFWKQMIYEIYDTAANKWTPAYKHVFSEFTYYVLNTPEIKKKKGPAGLHIIPNPSKNMLLIKVKDQAGSINAIKIYDITGREVLKRKGGINVKQKLLDISFLKSGTYIISVQTEKRQVLSGKFIKL